MYKLLQKHKHKSRHGARCAFISINKHEGVKLYRYKTERDFAFRMQQKAAKFKIGPKAIKKIDLPRLLHIDLPWGNTNFKYGYITQKAQVASPSNYKVLSGSQYVWLCNKMNKHGFRVQDVHANNVGLIDGKPVCIDFDRGTMG